MTENHESPLFYALFGFIAGVSVGALMGWFIFRLMNPPSTTPQGVKYEYDDKGHLIAVLPLPVMRA